MRQKAFVILGGIALAAAFWDPLWRGAGFVGGDVYAYYFPQKTYYAARLEAGEIPLWNPLAGHGYPVLGESQTGALYPANLALYRLLDVHAAYHVNHLMHYVLAFAAAVGLARSQGLSWGAASLAGLVYAYGWFPVRTCWEWAILGGAWLPAALWCAERLIQFRRPRDAIALCLVLAVQMLAGHYHIAFLTQLLLVGWCAGRLTFAREADDGVGAAAVAPADAVARRVSSWRPALLIAAALVGATGLSAVQWLPTAELKRHSQRAEFGELHNPARGLIPVGCLTQLFGWVRTAPESAATGAESWQPWSSPLVDRDRELQRRSSGTPTNQVEAHLYFGLVPLGLALLGVWTAVRNRDRRLLLWCAAALVSLVYATGLLVPWMQRLPGFGWFHGPGRFGLLTTLAGAMLAGSGLDALCGPNARSGSEAGSRSAAGKAALHARGSIGPLVFFGAWLAFSLLTLLAVSASVDQLVEATRTASPLALFGMSVSDAVVIAAAAVAMAGAVVALGLQWRDREARAGSDPGAEGSRSGSRLLTAVVFGTTFLDLWMTSRLVTYSPIVPDPPLRHLANSPVRKLLQSDPVHPRETVRLFAPGGNLPTVLGAGSTPPYFTFGPAEYSDPNLTMPQAAEASDRNSPELISRQVEWLRKAGVTHVLSFTPLEEKTWPVEPLWSGIDPFLNPAWARFREPLFLYRLREARGRAALETPATGDRVTVTSARANRVVLSVESAEGGRVVLTDLFDDGWRVSVDDEPAEALRIDGMFRGVDVPAGRHVVVWSYRPWSFLCGAGLSVLTVVSLVVIAIRRRGRSGAAKFL